MKFQINISIQVFRVELESQLKISSIAATKFTIHILWQDHLVINKEQIHNLQCAKYLAISYLSQVAPEY